ERLLEVEDRKRPQHLGRRGQDHRGHDVGVGQHAPEAQEAQQPGQGQRAGLPLGDGLADVHQRGMTSKSVRRFFARPSSVSLLATGLPGPLPTTSNLFRSKPFETRKRTTASARPRDSFTLASWLPTLSVFPEMRMEALPKVAARS